MTYLLADMMLSSTFISKSQEEEKTGTKWI